MSAAVRLAENDDVVPLASMMRRAFAGDEVLDWCIRPFARDRAIETFFTAGLRDALPWQTTWVAGNNEACASWLPPAAHEGGGGSPINLLYLLWLLGLASPTRIGRMLHLFRRMEESKPDEPHYYLSFLATDPAAQGRGLGGALMRTALAVVDEARTPAYLETVNRANMPYYERFGFEPMGEVSLNHGGPTIARMWRPARA